MGFVFVFALRESLIHVTDMLRIALSARRIAKSLREREEAKRLDLREAEQAKIIDMHHKNQQRLDKLQVKP